jgi:hypothetical protein
MSVIMKLSTTSNDAFTLTDNTPHGAYRVVASSYHELLHALALREECSENVTIITMKGDIQLYWIEDMGFTLTVVPTDLTISD